LVKYNNQYHWSFLHGKHEKYPETVEQQTFKPHPVINRELTILGILFLDVTVMLAVGQSIKSLPHFVSLDDSSSLVSLHPINTKHNKPHFIIFQLSPSFP
jgi:hypothetical protein